MKITYSRIEAEHRESIEKEFPHHVAKLNRLLQQYASDQIELHASLEKTPRKSEFELKLSLSLPTGRLHATGAGPDVRGGAKAAFAEIEAQVKKHRQKLRKDYVWKRKRARGALKPGEITWAD
ncbi:MAG TPA: HPF/RaiA family ribosome-associated protein [Candidatus Polarisedimenticolia bacterium]|nr:HPF/RaiA family ribosome-associated protein [Candidatus Polarisedimenticolia bacterium]